MTDRIDPVLGFNFYISLVRSSSSLGKVLRNSPLESRLLSTDLVIAGGFSECSGLEGTLQVEEYSEGGENRYVHKFPTRMTYANIILKRGITFSQDLWKWHYDYANGKGKRLDGLITLLDEDREPVQNWAFQGGMPLKWSGPTLNASQSAVAVETLEIIHQGWKPLSASVALQAVGRSLKRVGSTIGGLF